MYFSSKKKSLLQLRIQKKIYHILLDFFANGDFKYADVPFSITVSAVDISVDLKNLNVYLVFLSLKDEVKTKVIKYLNKNTVYSVKKIIAEKIQLKSVPNIMFFLDNSEEKAQEINDLIDKEKTKYSNNES